MKPFWPVDMRWEITQRFGENPQNYPKRNGHPGIDFACPTGSPIYAVADGKITLSEYRASGGYGREINLVVGNWKVVYGHQSVLLNKAGDMVKRGQVIGYSGGDTSDPYRGNSSGPHLHFEVRDLTKPQTYPLIGSVDPEVWLQTDLENPSSDVNSTQNHTNEPHSGILTVVSDYVNIRRDPSTNLPPVGRVLYGMDLNTTGKVEGNWHEITMWVNDGDGEYLE